MIISFNLNGKNVSFDSNPQKRVSDLLREDFQLLGTKCGCYSGICGACTILLDGITVLSCLLPVFTIRGKSIVTIEGFSVTPAFSDIYTGFEKGGHSPCGYCFSGKVLAIHVLLENNPLPNDQDIFEAVAGNRCRCDDLHTLWEGVRYAAIIRETRKHGRKT